MKRRRKHNEIKEDVEQKQANEGNTKKEIKKK
jgi:hypothetical protein